MGNSKLMFKFCKLQNETEIHEWDKMCVERYYAKDVKGFRESMGLHFITYVIVTGKIFK